MKSFIMSEQNLRALDACHQGINFIKSTGLLDLDFYKLKIVGDYQGYVDWLRGKLQSEFKYNNQGQLIEKIISPNEDIYKYKYNDQGQIIEEIYSNEYNIKYRYNDQGQLIEELFPYGDSYKYKYNDKGQLIERIHSNRVSYKFIYNNQNILKEVLYKDKSILSITIKK